MEELVFHIDKEFWGKHVMRVLMPSLRKLGDSHGNLVASAQPAKGIIILRGDAKELLKAKPELKALVKEHFPGGSVPELSLSGASDLADTSETLALTDGHGELALEKVTRDTLQRHVPQPCKRQAEEVQVQRKRPRLGPLSRCHLELSVVSCCKRLAVKAEDFDLALRMKHLESAVRDRLLLAAASAACLPDGRSIAEAEAELRDLERQKMQAVDSEDFDLSMQLKQRQDALRLQMTQATSDKSVALSAELDNMQQQKLAAIQREDYDRAAELRKQEAELAGRIEIHKEHVRQRHGREAIAAALRSLADSAAEDILLSLDPEVAAAAIREPNFAMASQLPCKSLGGFAGTSCNLLGNLHSHLTLELVLILC